MGRPRRGRAVLARGDGGQVPPPRLVRRPRSPRRSPTPRAAAWAAAPRSTAGSGTASRPTWPTSGATTYRIDEFTPDGPRPLRRAGRGMAVGRRRCPARRRRRRPLLERGAAKLGWRSVEFPRVFRYDDDGRGTKQTMARTLLPRAVGAGADRASRTAGSPRLLRRGRPGHRRRLPRAAPDGAVEAVTIARRPRLRVRRRHPDPGPAPAQRAPPQHRQRAQAAPHDQDRRPLPAPGRPRRRAHAPHHRVRARTSRIGGSASRQGPRRARPGRRRRRPAPTLLADWEHVVGVLRRHPQRRRRPGAGRCPGCARRSSPTGSPTAT